MDGFDASTGIVVMAATNRPDILDPALLRPGAVRPTRHDREARRRLARGGSCGCTPPSAGASPASVDFADIARRTPGFSGADLANVVNEAALLTIRQGADEITEAEFNEAILRVMSGPRVAAVT
jgi:cell division protease FtsH